MVAGVKMPGISEGFSILSDFRKLSFCGPCFFLFKMTFEKFIFEIFIIPMASHRLPPKTCENSPKYVNGNN